MLERRSFLKSLAAFAVVLFFTKFKIPENKKKIYLCDFFVAGYQYYDGNVILSQLKAGDELILKREAKNYYDEMAIEIYSKSGVKLGYIPQFDNLIPANLLDGGNALHCIINEIDHYAKPWNKVYCSLYLN